MSWWDNPREFLEKCTRIPLEREAAELAKKITLHHRVQGSVGLEKAVKEIAELLENSGLEVKLFEIPSNSSRGFIETPVSWDAEEGFLEIKVGDSRLAEFNYALHPTLISAHSPPSEGCSELKVCENVFECDGEAVLVEAPAYVAYKEISARLVVLYDSKKHRSAVPYTGLFIRGDEVKNTTVVNVPYETALRVMSMFGKGVKVDVCWGIKATYNPLRPLYGLLAYHGEDPGALYVSHVCHPKPGAHDNASGVVANILTARILKYCEKISHAHLFVPEYTGTVYASKYLPWIPTCVLNLDMVGSNQCITGSTLNIVNAPLFTRSITPPYVYLAAKMVLDTVNSFGGFNVPASRYSLVPYTAGSDHDVTTMWGLDSSMLNEWPSKFYHTDMDDINSLSPPRLVDTAVIAALAGNMATRSYKGEQVVSSFKEYIKSWYALQALKVGLDSSRLSRVLDEQISLSSKFEHTPISLRYIYRRLGARKYLELRGIKGAHTFLSVYAPLAYLNGYSDNPLETFQLENILQWSAREKHTVEEAWRVVREELG